jgi:hypothetical protein
MSIFKESRLWEFFLTLIMEVFSVKLQNTLFDECFENHAFSLALLLIYIDFDSELIGQNQTAYSLIVLSQRKYRLLRDEIKPVYFENLEFSRVVK